jgi:hypothetical protein
LANADGGMDVVLVDVVEDGDSAERNLVRSIYVKSEIGLQS